MDRQDPEYCSGEGELTMLKASDIQGCFGGLNIKREYPPSGQKRVFLVESSTVGSAILKAVANDEGRIRREIDIATEFRLRNVPRLLGVDHVSINGVPHIVILEEFVPGEDLSLIHI